VKRKISSAVFLFTTAKTKKALEGEKGKKDHVIFKSFFLVEFTPRVLLDIQHASHPCQELPGGEACFAEASLLNSASPSDLVTGAAIMVQDSSFQYLNRLADPCVRVWKMEYKTY
jgi:hypothetical protein